MKKRHSTIKQCIYKDENVKTRKTLGRNIVFGFPSLKRENCDESGKIRREYP